MIWILFYTWLSWLIITSRSLHKKSPVKVVRLSPSLTHILFLSILPTDTLIPSRPLLTIFVTDMLRYDENLFEVVVIINILLMYCSGPHRLESES